MKKALGIIIFITLAVMLFGCGKKEETKTETASAPVQQAAAQAVQETTAPAVTETAAPAAAPVQQAAAPVQTSALDVNTAKAAAVKATGVPEDSVCFTKAWLDFDDGIQQWEIEFVSNGNKYEIDLNAADGSMIKNSMQPVENGAVLNGGISSDEAKSAALAAAGVNTPDVVFTKIKGDFDDGIQKWEIEFVSSGKKYEVELNAADGSPLEMSQEMLQIAQ